MRKITYIGILSALTYILTAFVKLPLPNNGYIHAGNIVIVVAACLISPVAGGIIGVIGSVIADVFVDAPMWVPYTIVIKFMLGIFVGVGYRKGKIAAILLYTAAGVVVVGGYYAAEAIIVGNWLAPSASTVQLTLEYTLSLVIGLITSKKLAPRNIHL